ncbi:hypothetical protein N7492_000922 [Penicillium capsulatum]|uniref:Rhodanese domain-containing protein n=1 Tax=Penicillium capsulatum TaxID=69766 RepID=A0A9W9ITQ6_9EURO|nr:hypothetical protein N7492_000922 [Penicillium capsulatum]KAJ6130020.1 hypothetical protein N7512_002800 [Penicillium capsulatum]
MVSVLPSAIRRSALAIPQSFVAGAARPTILAASILQRGGKLSATSRGLSLLSRVQNGRAIRNSQSSRVQGWRAPKIQTQVRWNSDESEPRLRYWKFEEINAALPSESTDSPSHSPVILVDVREPVELTGTGIIPTAISIPLASQPDALYLTNDEFETRFGFPKPQVDGEGKIVFYCKAGVRAEAAAQLAVQAGYDPETLGVYYGSWLDWAKNGGRVERWEGDD